MNDLSPRQAEIYQFIQDFHQQNGYAPTFREIADGIGQSLSSAAAYITALGDKGYVAWEPKIARSIRIVKQETSDEL
jgi:repressor LexA